jgi:hypothetical protein
VQQWWDSYKAEYFPDAGRVNQDTPLPASATAEPPPGIECFLCGGNRDPYNLVTVMIHRWELGEIKRLLAVTEAEVQQTAKGLNPAADPADKPNGGVQ